MKDMEITDRVALSKMLSSFDDLCFDLDMQCTSRNALDLLWLIHAGFLPLTADKFNDARVYSAELVNEDTGQKLLVDVWHNREDWTCKCTLEPDNVTRFRPIARTTTRRTAFSAVSDAMKDIKDVLATGYSDKALVDRACKYMAFAMDLEQVKPCDGGTAHGVLTFQKPFNFNGYWIVLDCLLNTEEPRGLYTSFKYVGKDLDAKPKFMLPATYTYSFDFDITASDQVDFE